MVVETLRRFNRSYTQRIGVLGDSYLGTGRPLGPSRLLFEVDAAGSSVRALRCGLGLDSGYVSRMLRQLEADGLVTVVPDPVDRRQRMVRLTTKGKAEQARLERRSEEVARRLVAPLSERQRSDLAIALDTAERLLRAATVEFDVVDARSADARWVLDQYFAELDERFPTGFDVDTARDEDTEAAALAPPDGAFIVLRSDLSPFGCGGLQRHDRRTAEIKRMWIDPEWRGLGLGRRLVERLERLAATGGYRRVVLDTNDSLTEAIAMYQSMGFEPTERYNDNPYAQRWFVKALDNSR
jgi:DNA-binding MarR family transcriptional regulator/GNAT superfamily N-acetyltransferase